MNKSTILTLVGKSFAKKGFRFVFQGKNPSCTEDCKLYQTCMKNLSPNTVYEVVEIMKSGPSNIKTHICPKELHEEEMVLVRVQMPDVIISMRNKDIFVGSTLRYVPILCDKESCPHFDICVPEVMIRPNDKVKIDEKLDRIIDCSKGETLSKVKVEKIKEN